MSTFPSILTSYTNPAPTSPLNAPSHSGIEIAQNSGLTQLEATVGLSGSASVLGTIIGDLRSPASGGGGHIQSANTGGTGQTGFNKGDILAASSSSVLGKVGIGVDGAILIADSTQTSGMRWAQSASTKLIATTASIVASTNLSSVATTLWSGIIPQFSLSTNNAIRFSGELRNISHFGETGITFTVNYGNNIAVSVLARNNSASVMQGTIEGMIVANGSQSAQTSWVRVLAGDANFAANASAAQFAFGSGNSSTVSTNAQALLISATISNDGKASVLAGVFIADKIF